MSLTAKGIEHLKKKPGRYGDGLGLYLQVKSPTNCCWMFRYERQGRERWMGLGPLHTFSLAEARERARALRQQLHGGVDPLDARKAEQANRASQSTRQMSFKECTEAYFKGVEDGWRNAKHRSQFMSSLEAYVFPHLGGLPVADIDVGLVLKVLEQEISTKDGNSRTTFWKARPETASRVRGRIEKVLSWATVRGYRSGDNPARWQGFLSTQLTPRGKQFAPVKHHAALPFDELPSFVNNLKERTGVAARALEFLILTAARTGAVVGATWDEINLDSKVWTVPPDRAGTKIDGDKPRRVPLSDRTIQVLKALPVEEDNPHVFIGLRHRAGLSNMAMMQQLKRMGRGDITVHGFRSTFKDWVSERTNYPSEVSEAALWHAVADKVEAAYRRGDLFEKRRRLMQDWAQYCNSHSAKENVVVLHARSTG
jgi:integrase